WHLRRVAFPRLAPWATICRPSGAIRRNIAMQKTRLACWIAALMILAGCAAKKATTARSEGTGSALVPNETQSASPQPASDIDYSQESYRVVADKDLVCTVLKNGLTIIAKRISSPVVSVQGLCHTGSVYEGKWLGGGLSHLL